MFLQQLINGITQGSIYALISIGYALIFGVLGLVQFAHGEIYMIGAYAGYFMLGALVGSSAGTSSIVLVAFLSSMIGAGVLGMMMERLAFRPLRYAPAMSTCLATIALSWFLKDLGRLVFGAQTRAYMRNILWADTFDIAQAQVSYMQIVIMAVAVMLIALLQIVLYRTRIGMGIRAISQDGMAARVVGINTNRVISATFALGAALGGAAGIMVGLYYNAVFPMMGSIVGIKAFAATVFGGITSIPGAAVGGLFLGIVENLASAYIGEGFRDGIAFMILFAMLIVRPSGLFGQGLGGRR